MAQRRMFSKEITNSSEFQMMSPSAQALYFHIGMNADDDGFCEVFTIVRMTESKPDDLRALHERGLVFLVDSKVGIVKDWHTNNDIRSDRYTRSKYLEDKKYGDVYKVIMQDKIQHLSRYKGLTSGSTVGITSGITQVRIGKDRILDEPSVRIEYFSSKEENIERAPKGKPKYPHAKEVFSWFKNPQKNWTLNTTELKHAELLWERGEVKVKGALSFAAKHKDDTFIPKVTSPSELERKWEKLVQYKPV